MAHLTGKAAKVYSGVTLISGAHNWSIEENADTPESTDFASAGHKGYVVGNDGYSGSFELHYDNAQNIYGVPPNINVGIQLTMKFYVDAAKYLTGTVIITRVGLAVPQGDIVSYTVDFLGNDALDKSNM